MHGIDVVRWDPEHPYVGQWPDLYSIRAVVRFTAARDQWLREHGLSVHSQVIPSHGCAVWSSKDTQDGA